MPHWNKIPTIQLAAACLLLSAGCAGPQYGNGPWAASPTWPNAGQRLGGPEQLAAAAPTGAKLAPAPVHAPSSALAPAPAHSPSPVQAAAPSLPLASEPFGVAPAAYQAGTLAGASYPQFPPPYGQFPAVTRSPPPVPGPPIYAASPIVRAQNAAPYGQPYSVPGASADGIGGPAMGGPPAGVDGVFVPGMPDFNPPPLVGPGNYADIDAFVDETRTGRFMFGVGVNSDAGVTGQITIDERNFDWRRWPGSFQDVTNGSAFRGAGQGFRLEAMPGNQVQRYMLSFTEPYLFDSQLSFNLNAFFYDRIFIDWLEQRYGGRVALGYRLTPDLSASMAVRAENIGITNPRVLGVPQLDNVLGKSDFFSGRVTLTYDTRDIPFAPTEGSLIELAFEQAFGSFDFSRAEADLRKYYLVYERPDGSGRHTLSFLLRYGVTGSQTPIYENFFAGGFSTLRGFAFRGASPVSGGVVVGGQSRLLASAEYMYPITADDMLKGVIFVDAGTVEERIELNGDNFRVAPGAGLRINIPALGPAPLALDFAFPVSSAPFDNQQMFSFFFGVGR